jgi:hypothetical protein
LINEIDQYCQEPDEEPFQHQEYTRNSYNPFDDEMQHTQQEDFSHEEAHLNQYISHQQAYQPHSQSAS